MRDTRVFALDDVEVGGVSRVQHLARADKSDVVGVST